MSELSLRDATDDDLAELASMAHRAFRLGDDPSWLPYFRDNPHARQGHSAMVFVNGVHAGNATALDLRMAIRGCDLRVAGIAAVATAPEFRRRGVGRAALRSLLQRAREERTPWSMLFGISLAYYRGVGFGLAELGTLLTARGAAFRASPARRAVRPCLRERDEGAVRALYERARRGTTGQLVRGDYWWRERVFRPGTEAVVVEEGGAITGYALFAVPKEPGYPQQRVSVSEMRAETPFAWRALFGWADTLRDQFNQVLHLTAPSRVLAFLGEHEVRHAPPEWSAVTDPFGLACTGAMARVTHLDAALAAHPYAGPSARARLRVLDPLDGEPQSIDLIAEGDALRAEPSRAGDERLTIPIDALSTVMLGATRAKMLYEMGMVEGGVGEAEALDALFAPAEVHLGQRNHF